MQLKYLKTLVDAQDHISRIGGISWAPNQQKLAVATADRSIILFDENVHKRDKFSTKPSDAAAGKSSYVIRSIAFSPDSTRLAVAQSDNIVYVYKLGELWSDKKVICNKFPQPCSVMAMIWLNFGPIIVGIEDGKVRALNCKNNKAQNLYGADFMVVSLTQNTRGTGFLSGHEDGSIIRFFISSETDGHQSGRLVQHQTPPYALAWLQDFVVAAGCDKKIIFYDNQGRQSRLFDHSRDDNERDFTIATSSPNGQAVAIGSWNRIRVFAWSPRQTVWNEVAVKEIEDLYTVTSLVWRRDGSRLVFGSICGAVILFESVLRRTLWQDKFELTYVAPSQVLLKMLHEPNGTLTIESQIGREIDDVRIMGKDRYLVARTEDSLIFCDLYRNLTSEVSWNTSGRHERFYFENPNVCLVFNVGELSLIEYGDNYILGSVRTEFVNPHVISVRLNERGNTRDNKKLAYLLDMKTICVVDLIYHSTIAQITHESKIDWIELSETSNKLLYRDNKMRLILVDLITMKKQTLQRKVSFVQWVIQSDVVVAQSDTNLAIWYNIDMPEHVTMMSIRGEAIDVIREDGKTEVHTQDGATEYVHQLDEGLVEFGTAVNDNDFGRAVLFLESLGDKPAAKAMWHNLANVSMSQNNLRVAQRCYAALSNPSKVFYLNEVIKISEEYEKLYNRPGIQCPEVRARMSLLRGDIRMAEQIYLEQGDLESAIEMYKNLRRFDDAIQLAERRNYHGLNELQAEQMSYLMGTGQEEKAGQVFEKRGDIDQAMTLYLKAKRPAKAARLALKMPFLLQDEDLMARITSLLIKSELFDLAGDLSQKLQQPEVAITLYRKGGVYARAIELARNVAPEQVTSLEEEWGDWLVGKRQMDASISHYIEAGATSKALDGAVAAKQWKKAVQIAKVLDEPDEIKKYAIDLSEQLIVIGDIIGAEDLLIRAELYKEAVDLLNKHGQWEKAYDIAEKFLGTELVRDMFIEIAMKMEEEGSYRDAEKVLLAINEPDLAITMYKRLEHYDAMIRLVERYHKDLLESTHMHLGRQLEMKGKFKNAEVHFIAAGDWKSTVHMYCTAGKWEDAYRVAKQKGMDGASDQVAYMWSRTLSAEGAARLLIKMGLVDVAINYACDASQFEFALDLCRITGKSPDEVHMKMAMELEDEGKFSEAEAEFLLANKPREAVLMHTHSRDWKSAIRIAEQYLPESVSEILIGQANSALETNNYQEYEALLIRAERPELVLQHYRENDMWNDALRVAREYLPAALPEIQRLYNKANRSSGSSEYSSRNLLQQASEHARNEEFRKAAECLLQINEQNADQTTADKAMMRAAEICNQFLDGIDAMEIARELGPRLFQRNQIGPAAQLYLASEMPKEAVDVFIQTESWSKARRLAKEIDSEMVAYVEAQQKARLRTEGNVEQLADIDMMGALDLLAEQGQWTRCIEKAKQHSSAVMHKYLALYATQLIRDGDCVGAMSLYLTHGTPAIQQNVNIYQKIAIECFAMREPDGVNIWKDLRNFLYQLNQSIKSSDFADTNIFDRFDHLLVIAHYYATRAACKEVSALQSIAVRISIALLRYTETIPVDKAFYEAGMDLRSMNRESEAFVILNHYLDICDAIEEGSGNLVDHSDLAATDFPSSVPIPEEMHLKNEQNLHEEVREWVLAVSMDQRIDQVLPTDDRGLFESSLGITDQPCMVSCYPVNGKQPIIFQRSNRQANRDAWSKLNIAAKMAPHTTCSDIIEFIEKWCGPANFISN